MRSSPWASSPLVLGLLLTAGAALAPVSAQAAGSAAAVPTGRLLVLTDRHAGAASAPVAIAAAGVQADGRPLPQIGLVAVRPRAGESAAQAARRLAALPGVAAVEPERRMRLRAVAPPSESDGGTRLRAVGPPSESDGGTRPRAVGPPSESDGDTRLRAVAPPLPDDPALTLPEPAAGTAGSPLPAGTPLQWPLLRERFPRAWQLVDGSKALVGVIDTGVDASHPELAPQIARLVDQREEPSDGSAGSDEEGHGTHVASLACAATGNATGIAGAGDGCRLVVEKTDLSDGSIAAAIVDATDHGVHAINMSFGDDGSRPASATIRRALRYAANRDVVLVAAAADEPLQEQGDPANVLQPTGSGKDLDAGSGLSVTTAEWDGRRAPFAGYGSQISLAAYGTAGGAGATPRGVIGAFPAQPTPFEVGTRPCGCRATIAGDTRYGYLAGTSMAAPQVAAAAALVRVLNPDLSGRAVVRLLKRTARRPAGRGWNDQLGWGILDAGAALEAARDSDARAPRTRLTATAARPAGTIALRWRATDSGPPTVRVSGVRSVALTLVRLRDHRVQRRIALRAKVTAFRLRGEPGARYGLYAQSLDRAGNREPRPRRYDAVVRAPR
ncbi:S8 family serine peptidase [Conexibacter sp. JD483]|uniref:S8 family serine peptidase n=1 Tax=unclassified Conexibacter TaxID=2627773 RepID=UPI00271654DE|nr:MULTISPECIES: S8 family serine peptidase [unclassified Conexibacter]MDO8188045.1 S8 family serine peptidase [Conexibacter sp. CPCC 205706]MDO8200467.1 S8 family serine peptidase [Conexibacter sp. CPCC 205762]MDR9369814.1 S8 family serine peptidase [Conexibacter sp. JD483]